MTTENKEDFEVVLLRESGYLIAFLQLVSGEFYERFAYEFLFAVVLAFITITFVLKSVVGGHSNNI